MAFADRLLLNKTDLVTAADLDRIEARLRSINVVAPVLRCTQSQVSVDAVMNIHGFDLARALRTSPTLLDLHAPTTQHDGTVTSVSLDQSAPRHLRLVARGALDLALVQEWIKELLRIAAHDLFRMKGILTIEHAEQRYVYHAVHMLFSGGFDAPWTAGEPRESKMVFIGRNLDAKALASRFDACLATPENLAAQAAKLRFAVGDRVECRTGAAEWSRGTVVALQYRDARMPAGMVAPYQVRLDGKAPRLIWVPKDDDAVVRRAVASMREVLRAIDLEQYAATFEEQDMDVPVMLDFMKTFGPASVGEVLEKLGVASGDHRAKITFSLSLVDKGTDRTVEPGTADEIVARMDDESAV